MKKLAIICLLLCTLISTCLVAPASADAPANALDSHLIIHYDFEGEDIETQLKDKATAGASSDDLAYNGSDENRAKDLKIENGIAHTKGFAGLIADFRDENGSTTGADLPNNTTGEYTFYFDFKVYGDGKSMGGFRDFFNVYELGASGGITQRWIRLYFGNCSANGTKDLSFVSPGTGGTAQTVTTVPAVNGSFIQVAVTMKWDASTSKWNYKGYMSMDEGQTYFLVMEYSANNAENYLTAANALCLGNRSQNVNVAVEYDYDDVRVYNKALTADELVSINYTAPTTTEAPVTTDAPTTEAPKTDTPTDAATKAPETPTEAPETPTEAPSTNGQTPKGNTDDAAKSGCGASVVLGTSALAMILAGAWTALKKKED